MRSVTFSLRGLLIATAVCAFGVFSFQRFLWLPTTWKSGLRDSEILSATVDYSVFYNDAANPGILTKNDAIRLLRLAESCPTRDWDQAPTQYLPDPNGRDACVVEFELTRKRTHSIAHIQNTLRVDRDTLVDISSVRDEIERILWPPEQHSANRNNGG